MILIFSDPGMFKGLICWISLSRISNC